MLSGTCESDNLETKTTHQEQKVEPHPTLNITNNESGYTDALQRVRNKLATLNKLLIEQHKNLKIDNIVLGEWLALSTVLNMDRVCQAFHRGSLFYPSDDYHFASEGNYWDYGSLTTVNYLNPVVYTGVNTFISGNYVIDDAVRHPSQILLNLLFSYTAMDCSNSIGVAHYLTLFDLFKIIYGDATFFDELFAAKPGEHHHFNRLRLGTGVEEHPDKPYSFSPIYFFEDFKQVFSLDVIKNNPEKYVGSHIYIEGFPGYVNKHPQKASRGWHVIVLGTNSNSELLFLAANELGKQYVYSYDELKSMLAYGYNLLPDKNNADAAITCTENEVGQFLNFSNTFNLEKINNLLCDFDNTKLSLKEYCDTAYQRLVDTKNMRTFSTSRNPQFSSRSSIEYSKDDCFALPRFFKLKRKDIPGKQTCDDIEIDYDWLKIHNRFKHQNLMNKLLLPRDTNNNSPLFHAYFYRTFRSGTLANESFATPLFGRIKRLSHHDKKRLLENPNQNGKTIVHALVAHNKNMNAELDSFGAALMKKAMSQQDLNGNTPLHDAASHSQSLKMIEQTCMLLNPETYGQEEKSLSLDGPFCQNHDGLNPLHMLCQRKENNPEILDRILDELLKIMPVHFCMAKLKERTLIDNCTPLDYARKAGNIWLVLKISRLFHSQKQNPSETSHKPRCSVM